MRTHSSTPTTNNILTQHQIFPIDTAKSIYQRNCLVGGKDKQTRPKIQFLNPRMYRGAYLLSHSPSTSSRANPPFPQAWVYPCRARASSTRFSSLHSNSPRSVSTAWKSMRSYSVVTKSSIDRSIDRSASIAPASAAFSHVHCIEPGVGWCTYRVALGSWLYRRHMALCMYVR